MSSDLAQAGAGASASSEERGAAPPARGAAESVIADPNAALAAAEGLEPLRAVVVGAGGMGRWWARVVAASAMTELVGIADLAEGMPAEAIAQSGVADPAAVASGTDGVDLALEVGADLLINPTVPVAHHPVTVKALHAGIPVLGEKPVTETLPEALSLMAHAELTGVPFMVSQSRRFFPQVRELRRFVAAHGPSVMTSAFFSLFTEMEGYRRSQRHPLLRDMGIHAFDTARYVLDADPVAVTARGTRPDWSVYAHDASVTATFEMSDDSLFVYQGTWNARGLPTYWNSEWRIGAQHGSATWDGTGAPVLGTEDEEETASLNAALAQALETPEPDQIDASLIEFVTSLRAGRRPMCEVHENILSFAMVEAAVASVDRGERVEVDTLLEEARAEAIAAEADPDARAILQGWRSVREAIASR